MSRENIQRHRQASMRRVKQDESQRSIGRNLINNYRTQDLRPAEESQNFGHFQTSFIEDDREELQELREQTAEEKEKQREERKKFEKSTRENKQGTR